MKRTAEECVTTSPDTAKTFHPCHDKGEKVIMFEEKDVTIKEGKFPKTNMSAQVSSVIFLSFFSLRSKLDIQCRFISFSTNETVVINV